MNAGAEGAHGDNALQLFFNDYFIDEKCRDQNDIIVLGNVPNCRQG